MLYLNFARIFKIKGISKPFMYLCNAGYSGGTATKLTNNRVESINAAQLERFCKEFNCTPNDIFDFREDAGESLPKDHALHTLTKPVVAAEIIGKINGMSVEKMQQIHDIIKNME